jgi:hypothetical protein
MAGLLRFAEVAGSSINLHIGNITKFGSSADILPISSEFE